MSRLLKKLKSLFAFRELQTKPSSELNEWGGKTIGGYKINLPNKGFYDIKVGDKFEGCACGQFFSNQICQSINGDLVEGTTSLVIFRKEFIRPIKEDNEPPTVDKFGSFKNLDINPLNT